MSNQATMIAGSRKPRRGVDYFILWGIVILLMIFNALLAFLLLRVQMKLSSVAEELPAIQQKVSQALTDTSNTLEQIRTSTFTYTVQIDQALPIKADVPIDMVQDVPVDMVVPINTTVYVIVDLPIYGSANIPIPIKANVPVDLILSVPIQQNIPIDTTVVAKMDFPVALSLADMPLAEDLAAMQTSLDGLADDINALFDWMNALFGF